MAQGRRPNEKDKKRRCVGCGKEINNYRCDACWAKLRASGDVSDTSGYDAEPCGQYLATTSVGGGMTYQ